MQLSQEFIKVFSTQFYNLVREQKKRNQKKAHITPLPHNPDFNYLKKPFENIVGKGDKAGNTIFFYFSHIVFYIPKRSFNFSVTYVLIST